MGILQSTLGRTSGRLALAFMLAPFALPALAAAQDTPPASQAVAPDSSSIQDIIVTAQRRSERLQDTPVSVTALTADALASRSVTNLTDMTKFAPNLELHQTNRPAGGGSTYAAYIRGVGTGDFQFPTDPGVGLYVDDVYIARAVGGLLSLDDIARVEVLKGPQGTLFGRNTIGGAINVVSTAPETTGDVTGMIKLRAGSFGRFDAAGMLNGPLVEGVLGAKLSVAYLSADGPGYRPLLDRHSGGEGRLVLRGGLQFNAADNVDIRINADYTRQRQQPPSGYLIDFRPAGPTLAKIARYNAIAAPYLNPILGLPTGSIYDSRWESPSPFRVYSLQPQQDDSDIGGVSATVTWHLNDDVALKSISAWRTLDATIEVDGDQTPYPLQQSRTLLKQNQLSQEIQLGGTLIDGRLNFLVGAYAFREKGHSELTTHSFEGIYEALVAQGLTPTVADAGNTFTHFGLKATSYALFTQNTLNILDNLAVTAGARMNWDKKDYDYSVLFTQRNVFQVPFSKASAKWDSFTPKLGLDWHPVQDVLLYGSYSKGFKSGGFGASNSALAPTPRYEPEKLTAYEIGAKTSWFNRRLIFNVAAFYSEYRDIQLTVQGVDPITNANLRTTRNAGGANLKGFEAELTARPVPGLTLNAGAGYVYAHFNSLTPDAITSGFKLGDRVPQIPNWSVNGGIQYVAETSVGDLTLRGDLTYKGDQYLTPADATSYEKAYTILGARIAFRPRAIDGLELSVEGVNLTNKVYNVYKGTLPPTGEYVGVPSQPRAFYGTARFSF